MEQQQVFKQLLDKYLAGNISAEEKEQLETLLTSNEYSNNLETLIDKDWELLPAEKDTTDPLGKAIYGRIQEHAFAGKHILQPVYVSKIKWWAAASVAVLITVSATLYYFNIKPGHRQGAKAQALQNDVGPGGDKAILTLANGEEVILDSRRQGIIVSQSGLTIKKNGAGQIEYHVSGKQDTPVEFNTISTPPGGQFLIVLPDGSRVWLNSCSSLHFPTDFRELQRDVALQGEAYFEVAENARHPFNVTVNNKINIKVLGTRFNVMAYPDEENIRTTLLQGAVQLWNDNKPLLLKPGEEGRYNRNQSTLVALASNEEEALAWKNGYFSFEHADLKSIIRQLARWYGLEIVYEGSLPEKRFVGTIPRNGVLSGALNVLKGMGVDSRLKGKKLVIMPKD
ncbi:MAG TPA: FecR domain-containing protein [Chitinophaga sp.]|uniref:FecR family protein n=1 Tax=Chitinophaga sp. TaxID=1869181 RepID=UPI002C4013DE|nr:FecR domain-containing protein [Chitinophaga sp.]HVI47799.1 FecR domain-containing protein [Chitinophaga sp.]